MNPERRYDLVIAGGGAAGLSLLWHLLQSPALNKKQILLIDRRFLPEKGKTWCFWDTREAPYKESISHRWEQLEVISGGDVISETLTAFSYYCIKSGDFTENILRFARRFGNVDFLEATVSDFSYQENAAIVMTEKGSFSADWIFQNVLEPPGLNEARSDISLIQHFTGWEIETDAPLFNTNRATFMDFDVIRADGVNFCYVLPFSATSALIEYTVFSGQLLSPARYERALADYIKKRFRLDESRYAIRRKETGAIPMEDRRYPGWFCRKVLNTGTPGGLTKPSTGYTFSRIQDHCRDITKALETGCTPQPYVSPYRFRVYDMMLLYLLQNQPEKSEQILFRLFKRNRFERILEFLDEKTRFHQDLKIMASVPPLPFLKSILKMRHRIFTGA